MNKISKQKASGPDGFTGEFFKMFMKVMIPIQ
jgi:hypothetical protein